MIAPGGEISIDSMADAIGEPWQPVDLARVNETSLRLARLDGEFPWHHHDADELFLCWRGVFRIEMEGRPSLQLQPGELFVVPRGQRHRPVAHAGPAYALLVERSDTAQYGEEGAA